VAVTLDHGGTTERVACSHVISSMPFTALARVVDPPVPDSVLAAADDLHYRDFLTIALVVPEVCGFPDNWIYIHAPDVEVGRIQNFGSWSPFLVKDGRTCLGMEYFVFEATSCGRCPTRTSWPSHQGARPHRAGRPVRCRGRLRRADAQGLSVYDDAYSDNVAVLRRWFEEYAPNVHPVGRNGMHKYNNQDHSMYTAMLTVENIHGARHDIWSVNVEEEYHETAGPTSVSPASAGTGRDAPILPRRAG